VTPAARECARRTVAAALLGAATLAALGPLSSAKAGAYRIVFAGEGRTDAVETTEIGGVPYFLVADLARATGAVRHWNPRNGKQTLVVNGRHVSASADNQFVRCDSEVRNARLPMRREPGGLLAPPAYLTGALAWALDADVSVDADAGVVTVMTRGVVVTSASIDDASSGTALVLGLSEKAEFFAGEIEGAVEILVRAKGIADSLVLPEGDGVIRGVTMERLRSGILVTARLAADAGGYATALRAEPPRLEVVVERAEGDENGAPQRSRRRDEGHGVERAIDTVVIDAGHGGSDDGARGLAGAPEKDLSLLFAIELRHALEREGFHVMTTRDADETVPLASRAEKANLAEADVFISIHCGASLSDGVRGVRLSCRPEARRSGALGRWRDSGRGGGRAASRWNRTQDAFAGASMALAQAVRGRAALRAERPEIQVGEFAGLAGCSMPAVMVEVGYLTNAADARLLADRQWREGLARAIASGVSDYRDDTTREAM
jgi:N-acetylmuramoyl-L-alanine amidase